MLTQSTKNGLRIGYGVLAGTEMGAALGAAIGTYLGATLGLALDKVEAFLLLELLRRLLLPVWKQSLSYVQHRASLTKDRV